MHKIDYQHQSIIVVHTIEPMMKVVGARLSSFPLAMFTSEEEARAWAGERLAALAS